MNAPAPRAASFFVRAAALLVDVLVPFGLALALSLLLGLFSADRLPERVYNRFDYWVDIWNGQPAVLLVPVGLFLAFLLGADIASGFAFGRSLGKRLLRIRPVTAQGRPLKPGRVVTRALLRIVLNLPVGLSALWMLVDRQRRALHDLASGTWVVSDRSLAAPPMPPVAPAGPAGYPPPPADPPWWRAQSTP